MAVSDTCRVGNSYNFQSVARCILIILCAADNCMRHRVRQWLIGNICMIMYPYLIIIIIIIIIIMQRLTRRVSVIRMTNRRCK